MFKRKLMCIAAYLTGVLIGLLVGCLVIGSIALFIALLKLFPIVTFTVKGILTLVALLIIGVMTIEFINWLIVEPYRNHKRIQADAKREMEGPVE
ncbi:hypothetical protein P9E09_07050 [Bacillus mojavensis]|uniref:hypothetical protein n=1 Tax=Bacillus mojavensis TaxID=72360 RepID=UPI002DB5A685|nr:hypothetical protein [Bacillus mojavensis]MEC1707410.1 hypothetical protein [Bacillus mojavensis]